MTQNLSDKETEKLRIKERAAAMVAKEKELNKDRTGKGTRAMVGMTRGKNPQEVVYEAFDESKAETLPKTLSEFMDLTKQFKVDNETAIMGFVIDGFNSWSYTQASDPIAEYVDATWPDDIQSRFRLAVRNYSTAANVSIEDAVTLIRPGIVAAAAKLASEGKTETVGV